MVNLPTVEDVQSALMQLRYADLSALAERTGVPFHTLRKIRDGETRNPGLKTVAQFWPDLRAVAGQPGSAALNQVAGA